MGVFDLPALFKLVMNRTGQEDLTYMGHSQGCTQMFIAMMVYPEFFKKHMKLFVAIAPVLYCTNIKYYNKAI